MWPFKKQQTSTSTKPALPEPNEMRAQLREAIKQTYKELLLQPRNPSSEAIVDLLVEASEHIGAPHWMLNTRRIIGKGDFRTHYQEGLDLVNQAKSLITAEAKPQLMLIDLNKVKPEVEGLRFINIED